MQQAKHSQEDALVAARRAYVSALQQESRMVSESVEQWLAAMQAASHKIEAAFNEASEADDSEVKNMVIGARITQSLSEVSPLHLTATIKKEERFNGFPGRFVWPACICGAVIASNISVLPSVSGPSPCAGLLCFCKAHMIWCQVSQSMWWCLGYAGCFGAEGSSLYGSGS